MTWYHPHDEAGPLCRSVTAKRQRAGKLPARCCIQHDVLERRVTGLPAAAPAATTTAATVTAAAATTAAATEAATTTTAAAEAAATTAATLLAGTRLVDRQVTAVDVLAVERLDRGAGLVVILHLDEAEAAGTTRLAIHDQRRGEHLAVGLEELAETGLRRIERQIADVELHFAIYLPLTV